MKAMRVVAAVIAVGVAVACSQQPPTAPPPPPPPASPPPAPPPPPPPPPPGQPGGSGRLTASFTSPNSSDGAILLELRGTSIHGIALANSAWKLYADSSGTPIRIAIMGNLSSGALLTFDVPDVTAAASYSATIVDVADMQSKIRATNGYTITIAR